MVSTRSNRRVARAALLGATAAGAITVALAAPPARAQVVVDTASSSTLSVDSNADITVTDANAIEVRNTGTGGVSIRASGNLTTTDTAGVDAFGIRAEAQNNGSVSVSFSGAISTNGAADKGVFASVVGSTTDFATATINASGSVATTGLDALGVHANISNADGGAVRITSSADITTTGMRSTAIYGRVQNMVGASNASSIAISNSGALTTTADYSDGIVAGLVGPFNPALAPAEVSITNSGRVSTQGDFADGIFVNGLNGNEAADVTISNSADISTEGTNARGVVVQFRSADTRESSVTINSSANITVSGAGGQGISVAADDGMTLTTTVNVNGGSVQGGSGGGSGVSFAPVSIGGSNAGSTNTLNNAGAISALSGLAVEGDGGDEIINNLSGGVITGNVALGGGTNSFNNRDGGVLNAGATIDIGTGMTFSNAGDFSPGGGSTVQTTALTGNLVQSDGGFITTTFDPAAGTEDLVTINGSANLAGGVRLQFTELPNGGENGAVLTTTGGVTNNGVALQTSPAISAQMTVGATAITVSVDGVSFVAEGTAKNDNQSAIGRNLEALFQSGDAAFSGLLLSLANLTDQKTYQATVDQLSPELVALSQEAARLSMEDFSDDLLSCREDRDDALTIVNEGECAWMRYTARRVDREATDDAIGYIEQTDRFSTGAQIEGGDGRHYGIAFGFESANLRSDTGVDIDGNRFTLGGSVKQQDGPIVFGATASVGFADQTSRRTVSVGTLDLEPEGEYRQVYTTLQGRVAYALPVGVAYLKPMADIAFSAAWREGFTEENGGIANLDVDAETSVNGSFSPAIEFGAEFVNEGWLIHPHMRAGATVVFDNTSETTARFDAAPGAVGDFTVAATSDRVMADFGAGLSALSPGGTVLAIGYDGRAGASTTEHGGFAKASVKF